MTDTKNIALEIEPVNPGFIVREGAGFNPGGYRPALFACTTIDEALGFIRSRLVGAKARCDMCGKPGYLTCDVCPDLAKPR